MNPLRVNLTLPVFNEAARLAKSGRKLRVSLQEHTQFRWELVIANNGSTDRTWSLAQRLAVFVTDANGFYSFSVTPDAD